MNNTLAWPVLQCCRYATSKYSLEHTPLPGGPERETEQADRAVAGRGGGSDDPFGRARKEGRKMNCKQSRVCGSGLPGASRAKTSGQVLHSEMKSAATRLLPRLLLLPACQSVSV